MNSTIPADLLELKTRFETWRANRKYVREPIPDELWNASADLSRRYPPSLVGRVLKLDPSKLKKLLIKRSARTSVRKKPQAAFFQLPTEIALPEVGSPLPQSPTGCRQHNCPNRRVRNRIHGGVGGRGCKVPSYPDSTWRSMPRCKQLND
jgi:hypothetical protein